VLAGLASGTFYSLTMTFVLTSLPKRLIIFGIAAYAADIIFTSNIVAALQGWNADHLSWHWIYVAPRKLKRGCEAHESSYCRWWIWRSTVREDSSQEATRFRV
jgi:hypothetical protein